MESRNLLLLSGIAFVIYFSIRLRKSYYEHKNERKSAINMNIFYNKVAGVILGVIFIILYFMGYGGEN